MQGVSAVALRDGRAKLDDTLRSVDAGHLGDELLRVADVVDGTHALRRALADPTRESGDRVALARRIFLGKISHEALFVLDVLVKGRWQRDRHLVDGLETLGVEAVLEGAERMGRYDATEDELFRFERIVAGDEALAAALRAEAAPVASKLDLVRGLLASRVTPETMRLVEQAVAHPRGRRVTQTLDEYKAISARRKDRLTAIVTTAQPLDDEHRTRLAQGLERLYGRRVLVNTVVDPRVLGGMHIRVGDEVIDGTVSRRLDDATRAMASGRRPGD